MRVRLHCFFFFFNDTATTEIYTLPLHAALPICYRQFWQIGAEAIGADDPAVDAETIVLLTAILAELEVSPTRLDRKSTRLNSSHANISYAVFCLKKKTM